jgi:hypothetical protein
MRSLQPTLPPARHLTNEEVNRAVQTIMKALREIARQAHN